MQYYKNLCDIFYVLYFSFEKCYMKTIFILKRKHSLLLLEQFSSF